MSNLARLRVFFATSALHQWLRLTWGPSRLICNVNCKLASWSTLRPGTRVRINGRCCAGMAKHKGVIGTITNHDERPGHCAACAKRIELLENRVRALESRNLAEDEKWCPFCHAEWHHSPATFCRGIRSCLVCRREWEPSDPSQSTFGYQRHAAP